MISQSETVLEEVDESDGVVDLSPAEVEWRLFRWERNIHQYFGASCLSEHGFVVLLLAVGLFVHSPGWLVGSERPWVYDDMVSVVHNPCVTGVKMEGGRRIEVPWSCLTRVDYWGRDLQHPSSHKSFRPVTSLLFRLQMLYFGTTTPQLWHLTSAFLHATNIVAVYKLLRTVQQEVAVEPLLALRGCRVAALFFAVHPVHTEAICNITGLAEILAAGWALLSYILLPGDSLHPVVWFLRLAGSVLLATLATFSKETGFCAFPLICLNLLSKELLHFKQVRQFCIPRLRTVVSLMFVLTSMFAVAYIRLGMNATSPQFSSIMNPGATHSDPVVRLLTILFYSVKHCSLLLFPYVLCPDYQRSAIPLLDSVADIRVVWVVLLVTLVVAALVVSLRQVLLLTSPGHHTLGSALAWTLVPYLPASNLIISVGFPVAERVLYLPSVGVAMLIGLGWSRMERALKKPGVLRGIRCVLVWTAVVTLSGMALRSFARSWDWNDAHRIWLRASTVCAPTSAMLSSAAFALVKQHRRQEAVALIRNAVKISSLNDDIRFKMATLLRQSGRPEDAEESLELCRDMAERTKQVLAVKCAAESWFLMRRYREAWQWYKVILTQPDILPEATLSSTAPPMKDLLLNALITSRKLAIETGNFTEAIQVAHYFQQKFSSNFAPPFASLVQMEMVLALYGGRLTPEVSAMFTDIRRKCPANELLLADLCLRMATLWQEKMEFQEATTVLLHCKKSLPRGAPITRPDQPDLQWIFQRALAEIQIDHNLARTGLKPFNKTLASTASLLQNSSAVEDLLKEMVVEKFSPNRVTEILHQLGQYSRDLFSHFASDQVSHLRLHEFWMWWKPQRREHFLAAYALLMTDNEKQFISSVENLQMEVKILFRKLNELV